MFSMTTAKSSIAGIPTWRFAFILEWKSVKPAQISVESLPL